MFKIKIIFPSNAVRYMTDSRGELAVYRDKGEAELIAAKQNDCYSARYSVVEV